jgi:hypothetical protein
MIGAREAAAEQEASGSHAPWAPFPKARELYPPIWRQGPAGQHLIRGAPERLICTLRVLSQREAPPWSRQ